MQSFSLSKWYADCITDSGQAILSYAICLCWGPARINYQGLTEIGQLDWPARRSATLTSVTHPQTRGGTYTWKSPKLGFSGFWVSRENAFARRLCASRAGGVYLTYVTPSAGAEITFADGRIIRGLGYVERLDVTAPPWRLPASQLRWGRFISEQHSCLWFDWSGSHGVRFLFLNGSEHEADSVTEQRVSAGDTVLELSNPRLIREGTVGDVGLSEIPALEALLPPEALGISMHLWMSEATLQVYGSDVSHGYSIHQLISWPENADDQM